ncbi:chromosome partitioning protein ParB [Bacillus thuringiensis]|uniref:chromosome partitioning protein ParB n=1 Tax=Bacillus thuringiensis TaxID=1428 RepID=UPI00159B89F1|nr:chromosome partitioning protein ParB [Bacillus thuringiensis]
MESAKARERRGARTDLNMVENFPPSKVRDVVAEKIGIGSGKQYEKAKFIAENADPSTITKLDNEETSIHKAYTELKAKLKEKEKLLYQETEKRKRAEQETFSARKSEELTRKQLEEFEQQEPQIIEKEVVKEVAIESLEHINLINELNNNNKKLKEEIRFYREKEKAMQKNVEDLQQEQDSMDFMANWTVHTLRAELEELIKSCSFSSLQTGAIVNAAPITKEYLRRDIQSIRTLMDRIEQILDHTFAG